MEPSISPYINLGYEDYKELGPGEIVFVTADEVKTLVEPGKKKLHNSSYQKKNMQP